jgi:hypothetical protein
MSKSIDKEAMKKLREQRKATVDRAREAIKAQSRRITAIKSELASGPKTIPEIAAALGIPTAEALIFVSGLRKYGDVVEGAKNGDYFKYQPAPATGESK